MFGGETLAGFRERLGAVLTGDLRLDRCLSRSLAAEAAEKIARGGADALTAVRERLAEWDIDAQWSVLVTDERPRTIADWVEPYLRGVTLVLGCGDGAVGERLNEFDAPVLLCERERACATEPRRPGVPFSPYRGTASGLPACDSVLVAPAAGCAEDPAELFEVALRTGARRIVVIDTLLAPRCGEEMHALFRLFFAHCLCAAELAEPPAWDGGPQGKGKKRTLEEWLSAVERCGVVTGVERWESLPGVPLPHGLFAMDVGRGYGDRL